RFGQLKTGFVLEGDDSAVFLILRRSAWSRYYYLRLKVELKPFEADFDKLAYTKHDLGDVMMSLDSEHSELFDLENELSDPERTKRLDSFFDTIVKQWISDMLVKRRIIELHQSGRLSLLPFVKSKLGIE